MQRLRDSQKNLFIFIVILITITIFAIFSIWHKLGVVKASYRLHELQVRKKRLQEKIKRLEIRKEKLLNLKRVDEIAKNQLKMRKVTPEDIYIVVEE